MAQGQKHGRGKKRPAQVRYKAEGHLARNKEARKARAIRQAQRDRSKYIATPKGSARAARRAHLQA